MKHALTTFMMMLSLSCLSAQTISNVRVSQHPELRYYQITFDLSGKADELYQIKAVPHKGGRELSNLRYLSGQGITQPCSPGKDLQIFWAADLEGQEPEGWQFRLSAAPYPFKHVEAGSFQMGSTYGEDDEKPVHQVTVSSFILAKHEVTVGEFRAYVSATGYQTDAETKGGAYVWENSQWVQKSDANWRNPYFQQTDSHPVSCVSWFDAVAYCNWRSRSEGLKPVYSIAGSNAPSDWSKGVIDCDWTANGYRLPTEAEWEYSARGGKQNRGHKYAGSDDLSAVGWYWDNSSKATHPVGTKAANEQGIFDMSGNVWEWCWDWYDSGYYAQSPGSDPRGAGSGSYRVLRGGSWNFSDYICRVANRCNDDPFNWFNFSGLRLARAIF